MKISNIRSFVDDGFESLLVSVPRLKFNYKHFSVCTLMSGAVVAPHYHKKTVEKILCVYGSIILTLDADYKKEERYLFSGDTVGVPLGCVHMLRNDDGGDAVFIEFKNEEFISKGYDTYVKAGVNG